MQLLMLSISFDLHTVPDSYLQGILLDCVASFPGRVGGEIGLRTRLQPGFIYRPEEGLYLKFECILVSAMVHLPQELNFGSPTSVGKWC